MANNGVRSNAKDFLQNFRFHAIADLAGPVKTNPLERLDSNMLWGGEAGFSSVSIPEMSVNAVEYRDGRNLYTAKQPGIPTFDAVTMMRGQIMRGTRFIDWMMRYFSGTQYRAMLYIYIFNQIGGPSEAGVNYDNALMLRLYNAFPTRVKLAADLDSTSDDVSVEEIELTIEYFDVVDPVNPEIG